MFVDGVRCRFEGRIAQLSLENILGNFPCPSPPWWLAVACFFFLSTSFYFKIALWLVAEVSGGTLKVKHVGLGAGGGKYVAPISPDEWAAVPHPNEQGGGLLGKQLLIEQSRYRRLASDGTPRARPRSHAPLSTVGPAAK